MDLSLVRPPERAAPALRSELAERVRLGLWLVIASNLVFALTDIRLASDVLLQVYLLKAIQVAAAAAGLARLARHPPRREVIAIVLAGAAIINGMVAVSGVVTRDVTTTMILCLAFAWGTATLVPLGVRAQAAVALIVALSMLLNAQLMGVLAMPAMGYPAVALAIALGASIGLAYELERYRAALRREAGERTRADAARQRSEADLEAIFEQLEDVFYRTDLDGIIQVVSPSVAQLGYRPDEVIGLDAALLYARREDCLTHTALVMQRGAVRDFELTLRAKDGRVIAISENAHVVHDHTGRPMGIEGMLRDISARKRDEEALRQARDDLGERVRERTAELEVANEQLVRAADRLSEEERFVSAVVDTVGAVICIVDRHGRIVRLNRACEQTLGYVADELVGRVFWELFPEGRERSGARIVFERMLAGNWPTAYDTYLFTRAGERRCFAWSSTFITRDDGEIEYVVGTGIDITERQRAQDAQRRSEEHWRALIEQSTDLTAILSAEATVRYMSPSISRLLGYAPADWIGRPALELIHPDDVPAVIEALQAGLEHRDTGGSLTFRVHHSDGSWRVFEGTDTNLLDNDAVQGIVVNLRDVNERHQAEQEIHLLNRELEERVRQRTAELETANRELESFSYSVSHDLRAPLRHLHGFARILIEDHADDLGDDGRHCVERLQAAAEHMQELIDALLDLCRVSSGELRTARVDLSGLVQTLTAELERAEPSREVETLVAADVIVQGDPKLLRLVMENLLSNAWKYSSRHARARIEFGVQQRDAEPVYFVRDDGAGFDMARAQKLFCPFGRLHSPAEFEGTGIGLATVQRIVSRHGGRVWAEAAVEQGATFYFTLTPPR